MTVTLQLILLGLFLTGLVAFINYRKRRKKTRQILLNKIAKKNLPNMEQEEWEVVSIKKEQQGATNIRYIAVRLMAMKDRPYAGYELMQALLSAGLRYGSHNIFHYYEECEKNEINEKILFSLASALEPGTFELSQIGSITCQGLTFFMKYPNFQTNPLHTLTLMLDTARQLCEDLGGQLLNDHFQPLTEHDIKRWRLQFENYAQNQAMGDLLQGYEQ